MKIAELRTHVLAAPLTQPFGWSVDRTTVRRSYSATAGSTSRQAPASASRSTATLCAASLR